MAGESRLVVYFDDMRLVRDLLGDYDANLAVLEDRLGVEAVVNGNAVSLRGTEASCATAKSVLEQLYGRLAQGETIGVGEVVGAIRHARVVRARRRRRTGARPSRGAADPHAETPHHGADARAKRLSRLARSATTSSSPPGPPAPARPISPSPSPPRVWRAGDATG